MKALTDLVCVSTACPDDTSPINGWNPTDIHVRVYRPDASIRVAVGYRPTPESEVVMTHPTPFHERTSALTQQFSVVRDTWLPQLFEATGATEEYWACRNAATIQDMSGLRKIDVSGPGAERVLQRCLTRDVTKLSVGRGIYALMCDERGFIIDDGTLLRITPDIFRWCCGSDESSAQLRAVAEEEDPRVWIRDISHSLCNLAIQGPRSREILAAVAFTTPAQPRIENLKWFGCAVARIHDRNGRPFLLSRTGYTGELGYEIFCGQRDAIEVWDAVMAAGEPFGLTPMGGQALEMLRIEAGLMAAGAEFGGDVDPDEAGLGFAVDLSKTSFCGRDAIERNRRAERRRLVGLVFDGEEVPQHGDDVFVGRRPVGVVTSAVRSPLLSRVIAMARVAVEQSTVGTKLEVGKLDGYMKRLPCEVHGIPFVDPGRKKPRQ